MDSGNYGSREEINPQHELNFTTVDKPGAGNTKCDRGNLLS